MCIPGTGSQCTHGRNTLNSLAPTVVKMNAVAIPTAGPFDFRSTIWRIISGGAPACRAAATTGATDDLNSGQSSSQNGNDEQEPSNVLECWRIEPIDNLPAIKER